jgi:hypothetical protein
MCFYPPGPPPEVLTRRCHAVARPARPAPTTAKRRTGAGGGPALLPLLLLLLLGPGAAATAEKAANGPAPGPDRTPMPRGRAPEWWWALQRAAGHACHRWPSSMGCVGSMGTGQTPLSTLAAAR